MRDEGLERLLVDVLMERGEGIVTQKATPDELERFGEIYYRAVGPLPAITNHVGDINGRERLIDNYMEPTEKQLLDAISSLDPQKLVLLGDDLQEKLRIIAEKSPYESVRELAKQKLESS